MKYNLKITFEGSDLKQVAEKIRAGALAVSLMYEKDIVDLMEKEKGGFYKALDEQEIVNELKQPVIDRLIEKVKDWVEVNGKPELKNLDYEVFVDEEVEFDITEECNQETWGYFTDNDTNTLCNAIEYIHSLGDDYDSDIDEEAVGGFADELLHSTEKNLRNALDKYIKDNLKTILKPILK